MNAINISKTAYRNFAALFICVLLAACGAGSVGNAGSNNESVSITATANTTAQNLTLNTAMASFSPLTASGGAIPYTYSITSGKLPENLNLNTSTGAVTGAPTATCTAANVVFSVKDSNNVVASTTSKVSFTVKSTGGSSPSAGPVEISAIGYGSETTGAGSSPATKVSVSNLADAQAAIDAYFGTAGLEITYNGTVDFSAYYNTAANTGTPVLDQNGVALNQGDILTCTLNGQSAQVLEIKGSSSKPKSNITIIGTDGSSAQFGIHITSTSNNIIIRNMTIGLTPGGGNADIISLEGNASSGVPYNIWIDHNNLFTKNILCPGAGDSSFDGMIDVKKGVDKVTISYNWLHDHEKTSLNGFSDSDTVTRHITFAHNIFENLTSRTPLQRFGYSHMLNNYFSNIGTSGINVRMGGYSLIEGNYFENVQNPVTSRDSSAIGYWELRNNNIASPADFTTYGIKWVASGSTPTKDATDWSTTAVFPAAEMTYTYSVDTPSCIKDGLRNVTGAGKGLASLKCN